MNLRRSNDDFDSAGWLRRSFLGGVRREDVRLVLKSMRGELDRLADALERSWRERERIADELAVLRAVLTLEQRRRESLEQEIAARRAELEAQARGLAASLLADAEEQAARLRSEAAQRVGAATNSLEDILRVREQLLGELRGVVQAYGKLLEDAESGRAAAPAAPTEPAYAGPRAVPLEGTPVPQDAGLFARIVELDAGPFADFAELAAFERALTKLPKLEDVHIRRFAQSRADIELTLSEETPLVDHLVAYLPYRMEVTAAGDDRLTVEVRQEAAS
jgi:hypothetical protein